MKWNEKENSQRHTECINTHTTGAQEKVLTQYFRMAKPKSNRKWNWGYRKKKWKNRTENADCEYGLENELTCQNGNVCSGIWMYARISRYRTRSQFLAFARSVHLHVWMRVEMFSLKWHNTAWLKGKNQMVTAFIFNSVLEPQCRTHHYTHTDVCSGLCECVSVRCVS